MTDARLGFPAISDPRGDPRATATTISNIRQRIEQLESLLTSTQAVAQQASFSQSSDFSIQVSGLQRQINVLQEQLSALSLSSSGDNLVLAAAGEPLNIGTPVVWSAPGVVITADPTDPDRAFGLVGITTTYASTAGQPVAVQYSGLVELSGYTFTAGDLVYVGTGTGTYFTQDPAVGDYTMEIGIALSETELVVSPGATGFLSAFAELGTGVLVKTGEAEYATRTISQVSGRTVVTNGSGVSGNPTIDLATAGTAGTYVVVTTDAYGRVTSGAATQAWSTITGTPVTLVGYGITGTQAMGALDFIVTSTSGDLGMEAGATGGLNLFAGNPGFPPIAGSVQLFATNYVDIESIGSGEIVIGSFAPATGGVLVEAVGNITLRGHNATGVGIETTVGNISLVSSAAITMNSTGSLTVVAPSAVLPSTTASLVAVTSTTPAANGIFRPATNTLGFSTNSTERARINASGRMLLGTTTDDGVNRLQVSGNVVATNLSGTNTGDQTITLTGDVTGTGAGSFATTIAANAVSNAKFRQSGALAVVGRSANSTGNVADISATAASDAVLRESGSVIGFGTIATGGIANGAVTYAKIQNVTDARLLGRSAGSAGAPQEITIGSGLSLAGGALTATGGGGGSGTVTDVSVATANGVSGSVATSTTTPAITLTLGAITPTSVAASGAVSGSNLSGTNTGDQTVTLTGDVTGTGTGSFAATIAAQAVTYAKMQNVTDVRLIGRSAGSAGSPQEITVGSGLSLAAGVLTASGAAGVSSITGTANQVIASASTGAVTLSTPQDIASGSSPTFLALTITNNASAARFTVTGSTLPTNGIYLPAANILGFTTNSTERMRLHSSGRLLIGTTTDDGANTVQITGTLVATTYLVGGRVSVNAATAALNGIFLPATNTLGFSTNSVERFRVSSTGIVSAVNFSLGTAGNKFLIKEGANCSMGTATLVAGTVTVNNTLVTANSRIIISRVTTGGTVGTAIGYTVSAGTSFTITSDSVLDTSTVIWLLIEPA